MGPIARLALLLVLAGACSDEPPPDPPARFNRPGAVSFACLKLEETGFNAAPMEDCGNRLAYHDLHALVAQTSRGEVAAVNLEAGVVLDSRRDVPGFTYVPVGEFPVSIVVPNSKPEITFVANFGSRDITVLQTRAFGVLPPGLDPALQTVPVAAGGDDNGAGRGGPADMVLSPDETALYVSVPERGVVLRMPLLDCELPEDAETTKVDCIDEAGITEIPLLGSVENLPELPEPITAPDPYSFNCPGFERLDPEFVEPAPDPAPKPEDDRPVPMAMALDDFCLEGTSCPRRLLVGDFRQPLIHVIDVDALEAAPDAPLAAIATPIPTGVPVVEVIVTPRVPDSVSLSADETQYIYAVDATDNSVLVLQDGVLLHPNRDPRFRPDRVPMDKDVAVHTEGEPAALLLEVLTPRFDVHKAAGQWVAPFGPTEYQTDDAGELVLDDEGNPIELARLQCVSDEENATQDPWRLRGVFVAAALSDGTIRILDVHDMELKPEGADDEEECRQCEAPPTAVGAPVLERHHPRLGSNFVAAEGASEPIEVRPGGEVFLQTTDRRFEMRDDGTTASPQLPALACIVCPEGYGQSFPESTSGAEAPMDGGTPMEEPVDGGMPTDPEEGTGTCSDEVTALVCAPKDPWYRLAEQWTMVWEGRIPEASGSRGRFVRPEDELNQSGALEFSSEVDFCGSGVLGDEDTADGSQGDMVVITSSFPSVDQYGMRADLGPADILECLLLAKAVAESEDPVMAFGVRRAYADRLVITQNFLHPIEGLTSDYTLVQKCLDVGLMRYEVRTRDSYIVWGNETGFPNRVIENESTRRCLVDASADPLLEGRARPGRPYANQSIELHLCSRQIEEPPAGFDRCDADTYELVNPARLRPTTGTLIYVAVGPSSAKVHYQAGSNEVAVSPVALSYEDLTQAMYMVDNSTRGLIPIPLDPLPPASSLQFE